MSKVIFIALCLVSCATFFSFKMASSSAEIRVTVTAERVTSFDMFRNNETIKGLKRTQLTPIVVSDGLV